MKIKLFKYNLTSFDNHRNLVFSNDFDCDEDYITLVYS